MDENNNLENNNITPSVEPTPVAPVENAAPVEPSVPLEPTPEVPAEPVAPVEQAPVEPAPAVEPAPVEAAPVEPTPAEPTMPTEPSATTQIPVQPAAPLQGVVEQPPKKKGVSIAFIVIVLILVLAICGLGIGLIVLAITTNNVRSGNTTTTTVQVTEGTSTIPVTTQETTTTIPRTTRSIDTPTPTSTDDVTVKVGNFELPLATGYQIYKNSSTTPIVVSTTKKIQISLLYNGGISYSTIAANPSRAISDLQSHGCKVVDATSGVIGSHQWMLFLLDYPGTPDGYKYVYGITSLSSGVLETAILIPESSDLEGAIKDINYMLDNAKTGTSSFAPSNNDSEEFNTGIIDNIDSRIFE